MTERFSSSEPAANLEPRLPGFIALVAIVVAWIALAWTWSSPAHSFSFSNSLGVSALAARGFFTEIAPMPAPPVPWAQINLPVYGAIHFGETLNLDHAVWGWAAQALLSALLLWRGRTLILRLLEGEEAIAAYALFLLHPQTWVLMLFQPGAAVTLWLFIESAIALHHSQRDNKALGLHAATAVIALSACASDGLIAAVMLALVCLVASRSRLRLIEFGGIAFAAVAPMACMIALSAIYWSVWAGPWLSSHPDTLHALSFSAIYQGVWTEQTRSWLAWLANGGVTLPWLLPLHGFFSLLGLCACLTEWRERRPYAVASAGLMLAALMVSGFIQPGAFFPLFDIAWFLTVIYAAAGLRWLSIRSGSAWLLRAGAAALCLIFIACAVFEWRPFSDRARYRHTVAQQCAEALNNSRAGVTWTQFSPWLFASLESPWPAPLGLRLHADYFDGQRARSGLSMLPDEQSPPERMLMYAGWHDDDNALHRAIAMQEIETTYQIERFGALEVWSREKHIDSLNDPLPTGEPIGPAWTFEQDFDHTVRVGAAFGLSPLAETSAEDLYSAGAPSFAPGRLMGALRSEPFVIEGDELSAYADIPKGSTQSYFCLAVFDRAPADSARESARPLHLFNRMPGAPLMGERFVYVETPDLRYAENEVRGWRVVHALQHSDRDGWRRLRWTIEPWRGMTAIWLAADRDLNANMRIDGIVQHTRPPGRYWHFEHGSYEGWAASGDAFGDRPALAAIGAQSPVSGYEGNFFANSYLNGSDLATGRLSSEPFTIDFNRLSFLIGGGDDSERIYAGLEIEGETVLRASGERTERLRRVTFDLFPWLGQEGRLVIVDESSGAWGHILADDFRLYSAPESASDAE